ncbi:MAG: nitrogenase cofactor biosynthesis protein NifB [Candidatus Methanomethylophilaceae archaeon]|nr:nitrogenase cofactor biosynthesis protein NifB [Candidatus Methanomethylophilaceae archaeon]
MVVKKELEEALRTHPCYNEEAHHTFARMHLPVAPRCNIQCNYCNRKFDCSNESRPGVTSEVLTPEQSIVKIRAVLEKVPNLKVIGIAGPGDPLANKETFRTLELVKKEFPDLTLCVSTNGLALPDEVNRLYDLGVRFLTVTMNACDPQIGEKIYDMVIWKGIKHTGKDGAEILMKKQLEGIKLAADLGMLVKVNVVMVPGVNDKHIPELVKKVKSLGAYIINILPLIPVEGTNFSNMRAPTSEERKTLMDECSIDAKMMRHCKQCRADAIGLLDNDRSGEFLHFGNCKSGCGPASEPLSININNGTNTAVASNDGNMVDSGFGNATKFRIYSTDKDGPKYLRTVEINTATEVSGNAHRDHIGSVIRALGDCNTIVVKEIGHLPSKILESEKKKIVVFDGMITDALYEASKSD